MVNKALELTLTRKNHYFTHFHERNCYIFYSLGTDMTKEPFRLISYFFGIILILIPSLFYGQQHRIDLSEWKLDSLKSFIENHHSKDSIGFANAEIAKKIMYEDVSTSINQYKKTIAFSEENELDFLLFYSKLWYSYSLTNNGEYSLSMQLINEAIDFFEKEENAIYKKDLAEAYIGRGFCKTTFGDHHDAELDFIMARSIFEEINDIDGELNALNRLGIVKNIQKEEESAVSYFEELIDEATNIQNERYLRMAHHNVGLLYLDMNNISKADYHINKSIEYRLKQKRTNYSMLTMYSALADLERAKGNINLYREYADSSLVYNEKANYVINIVTERVRIAEDYLNERNWSQAQKEFDRLKAVELQLDDPGLKKRLYQFYADYYEAQGKMDLSRTALKVALSHSDTMRTKESTLNTERINRILDLKKYEKSHYELLNAQAKNEILLQQQKNRSITLALIGIILSIILVFLWYISRLRQKRNEELIQKNNIISQSLQEKETLMQEIHHRVKNNLQVISSILNIQARHIQDNNALQAVKESRDRVKTMALIHQKMYQNPDIHSVSVRDYIETLGENLKYTYRSIVPNVILKYDCPSTLFLDPETLTNVGLILNELVTNAMKYAFEEHLHPEIQIVAKEIEGNIEIEVKDNGKGLDQDKLLSEGFGFELVKTLSHKLKGEIEMPCSEHGFCVRVRFPMNKGNAKN